jgi:chitin disaccharide deacetylase
MDDHPTAPETHQPPVRSSELLGFPPDARVLIINCDDFGMYHAVNAAVIRSIEEGIARSCSLMVPCPWALHAMQLLRERPEIPFGIHLTLLLDVPHYRWRPLTAREKVPSLLDGTGEMFLWEGMSELLAGARLDEVELEFRAQIDAVVDAGLAPTHLDFHSLADGGRPDILDLTVELAREYGLAVRVWLEPGRRKLRARGLPVDDYPLMDSTRIDLDGKPARFARLLRELPAGLSEWAVHPSLGDEESQAVGSLWRERQTDFDFLTSPAARDLILDEGIQVIDYRPMQRAWSGSGPTW